MKKSATDIQLLNVFGKVAHLLDPEIRKYWKVVCINHNSTFDSGP